MSSEDVDRLCRMLAALNYDGQRSNLRVELFERPNLRLVCDILKWFARILGDESDATTDEKRNLQLVQRSRMAIADMNDIGKISFLIDSVRLFKRKLGIQLDPVALYRADAASCPELLKVAHIIFESARLSYSGQPVLESTMDKISSKLESSGQKLFALMEQQGGTKELSAEIDQLAKDLDKLLVKEEKELNGNRLGIIERRIEVSDVELAVKKAHESIEVEMKELKRSNEELENDLVRLDERLSLKEREVKLAKNRLDELLFRAPAYVESYNKLYKQYLLAYEAWVSRFRNLMYLKSCVYSEEDSGGCESEMRPVAGWELNGSGAARLLESLFEGDSKPMSASLTVEDVGAGGAVGLLASTLERAGLNGAGGAGGAKGAEGADGADGAGLRLLRYNARSAAAEGGGGGGGGARGASATGAGSRGAGGTLGLGRELEGLLSEFVADSGPLGPPGSDHLESVREGTFSDDDDDDEEEEEEEEEEEYGFEEEDSDEGGSEMNGRAGASGLG